MSEKKTAGEKYVSEHYDTANMAAAFNRGAYVERLANKEGFCWLPDETFMAWHSNCPTAASECREALHSCFMAGTDSEDEDA